MRGAVRGKGSSLNTGRTQSTWIPIEDSFLLVAVGGCCRVNPKLRVSFWDWVDVEVVEVATLLLVVVVGGGGRSRGAGTGWTAPAAGAGAAAGTGTGGGRVPFARLPVRMLQRLSDELLRPDWLLASLPRS